MINVCIIVLKKKNERRIILSGHNVAIRALSITRYDFVTTQQEPHCEKTLLLLTAPSQFQRSKDAPHQ